jgi:hypothetical protein
VSNHQRIETTRDRKLREDKQREHERDYTDPEKHYVRKDVWLPSARNRLQAVNAIAREQRRLKYFTLCAKKAIDVHLFGMENIIELDERGYPTVVFCECYPDQYVLILRVCVSREWSRHFHGH